MGDIKSPLQGIFWGLYYALCLYFLLTNVGNMPSISYSVGAALCRPTHNPGNVYVGVWVLILFPMFNEIIELVDFRTYCRKDRRGDFISPFCKGEEVDMGESWLLVLFLYKNFLITNKGRTGRPLRFGLRLASLG